MRGEEIGKHQSEGEGQSWLISKDIHREGERGRRPRRVIPDIVVDFNVISLFCDRYTILR